ncbi:MAG: ParA family protein, partial [Lachnospiraceae bacterium]
MPYIIAFANQKGGVGKTTSAVNIAACTAALGKRVLLVDADPQGNATSACGINKRDVHISVYDAIIGQADTARAVIKTKYDNLSVLPSTISLAGAEFDLIGMDEREKAFRRMLAPIADGYDVIMIDCPPSLGLLTVNALSSADGVLIPMQCEYFALEGLTQLM